MSKIFIRCLLVHFLAIFFHLTYGQTELLEDFSVQLVNDELDTPNGLVFDQNGNMYVWEKGGRVWLFRDGEKREEVFLDLSEEVMSNGDLGFMSIALDPDFENNGHFYCYYVVDYHHLIYFGTPDYNPNQSTSGKATIGRVTRYTVEWESDVPRVDYTSRKVLIGHEKEKGIPILHTAHVGGTLLFGDDNSLLLSIGDCSTWEGNYVGDGPPYFNAKVEQALEDGIIRPEEEVGVMRSQMINSYSGKVIRFHPETGLGLPSNPFYDEENPDIPASKVWALGFRNPYRMAIRRGSGSTEMEDGIPGALFVGEVGAGKWEELNIITQKGLNFGWPIFEGVDYSELSTLLQTNKDVINDCDGAPILFQDLIVQKTDSPQPLSNPCNPSTTLSESVTFVHEPPVLDLAHITVGLGVYVPRFDENGVVQRVRIEDPSSNVMGDVGDIRSNAAIAGAIYTGDKFPEEYKDDLFITDFNNGWICRVELDLNEEVQGIYKFYDDTFKIVSVNENPFDGCLYVIENTNDIKKICYDVNVPPVVTVEADKLYGSSPLTVNFDASSSYDPEGGTLNIAWDFGDGLIKEMEEVSYTFESDEVRNFEVSVTISDDAGNQIVEELSISLNNSPPTVEIVGLENNDLYSIVGANYFDLESIVQDKESNTADLEVSWKVYLHHNTHFHEEAVIGERDASIEIPAVGCGNEVFYYRIVLEAIDPQGLSGVEEVYIYPDCENVFTELTLFAATANKEEVITHWETRNEKDIAVYELERAASSKNFVSIGNESPKFDPDLSSYDFIDDDPVIGPQYYRLKMIDRIGNAAYSEEIEVIFSGEKGLFIYPVPATEYCNIHLADLNGEVKISVFSPKGEMVFSESFSAIGAHTHKIDLNRFGTNGTYLIRIERDGRTEVEKLIISK